MEMKIYLKFYDILDYLDLTSGWWYQMVFKKITYLFGCIFNHVVLLDVVVSGFWVRSNGIDTAHYFTDDI